MADTVQVGHKKFPKWAVYTGIGVVVVGGILYVKKKNGGSLTSSASSQAAATDPVTGLPYSSDNQIDPATGMTYLAEAQQYGSVSAAQAAISSGYGGVSGTGFGASGLAYGAPSGFMTNEATPGSFATNAEWAQAAQAGLPGITGDSSSAVSTALATYLAGLPLTSDQANIVRVALAEYGPVPSGNLQIIMASTAPGPTSTGGGGDTGGGSTGGGDTGGGSTGGGSTGGGGNTSGLTAAQASAIQALQAFNASGNGTGITVQPHAGLVQNANKTGYVTASGSNGWGPYSSNFGGIPAHPQNSPYWPTETQDIAAAQKVANQLNAAGVTQGMVTQYGG